MRPIETYWVEALAVIGGARIVVQALYGAADKLQAMAAETEATWDDEAMSKLVRFLELASSSLEFAAMILSPLALKKKR